MYRRIMVGAALLVATALLAPAAAGAATKTIYAGVPPSSSKPFEKLPGETNAFYRSKTVIRAGDKVRLVNAGFHNFDFPAKGQAPLPLITFDPAKPATAVDAAGAAFWFNGQPSPGFNPALFAPQGPNTYDGTQRVATALPFGPPSRPRVVTLPKPGSYKLFCDVHPGMRASIVVRGRKARVPSRRSDAKALAKQVRRALADARRQAKSKPPRNTIQAGATGSSGTDILAMFPRTLNVKVGDVVTARMPARSRNVHTFTFGPDPYVKAVAKSFESPAIDPAGVYPSEPPGTRILDVGPTTHGNGYVNSGVLANGLPNVASSVRFRFTAPGSYKYICLIHPLMVGTVKAR